MFRKLKKKQKRNLLIGFLVMSILFMATIPNGTFNPTKIGFYISIFGAMIWALTLGGLLNKYQKPKENKKSD